MELIRPRERRWGLVLSTLPPGGTQTFRNLVPQIGAGDRGVKSRCRSSFFIYSNASKLRVLEAPFFPPGPHEALQQEGLGQSGSGTPSLFQLCRMFGDVPPLRSTPLFLFITAAGIQDILHPSQDAFPSFPFSSVLRILLTVLLVFTSLTADRSQESNLSLNIHLPFCPSGVFF